MFKDKLDAVLPLVEKPARYVDNEWNSMRKEWDSANVKMVFAYPDTYEIGMSHLGLQILYCIVNREEHFLMERVFAPWTDMEKEMRLRGIPLFSLESHTPVKEFDVIGFTLQYELNYTNILNMLNLAGIPLRSIERNDSHPLIIAGGPTAFNPEPLAPFIDLFVMGEAEESIIDILNLLKKHKLQSRQGAAKESFFPDAVRLPGIYFPAYYSFDYNEDGTVKEKEIMSTLVPLTVKRRVVKNLDTTYFPTAPIVPNIDVVHNRMMVEVARGCASGCRFCQAGFIYRPVRERSSKTILEQAEKQACSTGYDEISLVSLNTADYSDIKRLTGDLSAVFDSRKISISLPSLRINKFSVDLAHEIQKVRKSTLTFAPEAGTQRLRNVINKGVDEDDMLEAASAAFRAGWSNIKLYFMIGLPSEKYEDLDGIVDLAIKVLHLGRDIKKTSAGKKVKLTVSVSSFVPKPHTPFQWHSQDTMKSLKEKQRYLKSRLTKKGIIFKWHEVEQSYLECMISKGNREVSDILETAWENGCRFDSWTEKLDFNLWIDAFEKHGFNPSVHVNNIWQTNAEMPWDHIDVGVSKKFLISEYRKALASCSNNITEDCRFFGCSECGVCSNLNVKPMLGGEIGC